MSLTPTPPLPPVLDAGHLAAIERAGKLYRPLRRARSYAMFDAWSLAIFGVITLLTGYSSPSAIFIGVALAVAAFFEFRGIKMLAALDLDAPLFLARNQLFLAASLILYAVWNLIDGHLHPTHMLRDADPSLASFDSLEQYIYTCVYVALIAIAIFFQGSTALFYRSRQKHLQIYLTEIPEWARTLRN